MKRQNGFIAGFVSAVALSSLMAVAMFVRPASAAIIPGLFNTGVDGSGAAIAPPSYGGDSHYTLQGPGFSGPADVISEHYLWVPPPAGSKWIGINSGTYPAGLGFFSFTTTFDLTGMNPATANIYGKIAADNDVSVFLNGIDSGVYIIGYSVLANFSLTGNFISGINTLRFDVENYGGPMGLLVADLTGSADLSVVPLPPSAILFATGLIGLGAAGRQRRRKKAAL